MPGLDRQIAAVGALVVLIVLAAVVWGFKGVFFSALLLTPVVLLVLVALSAGWGVPKHGEG